MTTKQLAWGIAVWPFVFVLEFIGQAYLVDYDWDLSTASVLALISGYTAVALLIASLIWLPAGVLLSRLMKRRSRTVQGIGFGAMGLALGVLAAMIMVGLLADSVVNNRYTPVEGDLGNFGLSLLQTTALFILPSLLGWFFATAMTARSADRLCYSALR